jgi:hypothetical protein
MKKCRWIIQNNLIAENDIKQLQNSCKGLDIEFEEILVIPFSKEIPKFTIDNKANIYYGSTTLINNVYKQYNRPIGVFYDDITFTMENYLNVWREHMLSYGAKITTLKEFTKETHKDDELFFIRPNADDKSFGGEVLDFKKIKDWHKNFTRDDNVELTEDTKILVGEAFNIEKEWRNYVVNGKVVTSSLYRKNFKLSKSREDAPTSMIKFVEDRCKEYQPHDIFAMDIALNDGEYYIIECGCLNSVGFYASDISKIVKEVSNFISKKMEQRIVKLEKVTELDDAKHSNNIEIGYIKQGLFIEEPVIGKSFWVGYDWATSTVREIVDGNTFKTLSSIYKWSIIN